MCKHTAEVWGVQGSDSANTAFKPLDSGNANKQDRNTCVSAARRA